MAEFDTEDHNKKPENPMIKKRWFGRGIYGSKDVPIRLLDKVIITLIVTAVLLTVYSTITGGFQVTFDSVGGSAVESQKIRHGNLVAEPEVPEKPGFEFMGWYNAYNDLTWDFSTNKVGEDLKLTARWQPAKVAVKFDLDGGLFNGLETPEPLLVTFGDAYGTLPVPEKQGYTFGGWEYSGKMIEVNTKVTVNGEHVLTALWKE